MNGLKLHYTIYPSGERAICFDLGARMDPELNQHIRSLYNRLTIHPFTGFQDAVMAYSSLTVYYDPYHIYIKEKPSGTVKDWVSRKLLDAWETIGDRETTKTLHKIPVCYDPEWGMDLENLALTLHRSLEDLIQWHTAPVYRIYMIGFQPGFPYMGETPEALQVARKTKPVQVKAGSVGIAGRQTGIYPFDSPGGWHIIGRTPVRLFDAAGNPPVPFRPGDEVCFYSISREQFDQLNQEMHVGSHI